MDKDDQAVNEAKKIGEQNREIILAFAKEGKLPYPRALTRKERKKLDAANMNMYKIKPDDKRSYPAIREDCADWILSNIFGDFKIPDDLPNNICLWFGSYVFGLTYRDDLSEKN